MFILFTCLFIYLFIGWSNSLQRPYWSSEKSFTNGSPWYWSRDRSW